jgi:hypothetical protein
METQFGNRNQTFPLESQGKKILQVNVKLHSHFLTTYDFFCYQLLDFNMKNQDSSEGHKC